MGVAIDKHGALLVADDVGNVIWRASGPPGFLVAASRFGPAIVLEERLRAAVLH